MNELKDGGLERILRRFLKKNHFILERMSGDAGQRRYSRLISNESTFVVMEMGEPVEPRSDSFFLIRDYLDEHHIPVPQIYFVDRESGVIVMEDLGDEMLQTRYRSNPSDAIRILYPQAMEMLLAFQNRCLSNQTCPAFSIRFDSATYMRELLFFETHFLKGYLGLELSPSFQKEYRRSFRRLADMLSDQPLVFTHRDFHSRNLMVRDDRLVILDFQDARLGCPEYDLVSLLRDAYVVLPEQMIDAFIEQHRFGSSRKKLSRDMHREACALMCIQRAFKAMGTFGYQSKVFHNDSYLQYVPNLIHHLRSEFIHTDQPYTKVLTRLLDIVSHGSD